MSLILEALKKSERERRLGEAPSIGSPVMAVRHAPNRLPWLIGLIVLALAAGWWLRRAPPPETPGPVAAASVSTDQSNADAPLASTSPADAAATPEPPRSTANSRVPRSKVATDPTAAMPPDLREKVNSGEIVVANPNLLIPGQPSTIKESEPMPAPPPGAEAGAAPPALESWPTTATPPTAVLPPAEPAVQVPTPAPATPPAAAIPAPLATQTAPLVATPPPAAAAPVTVAPAAAPNAVKLLWELPYAQRREIPELKVTMHVFDATPAARFIIVNGNRQVEGDDIEGLKLIEIRADGVVLESQGQRFLYPRGGR